MNKSEFLSELERQLKDISNDERENALSYYRNYFDDAGPENEQKLIDELNSPTQIASEIKRDLGFIEVVPGESKVEDENVASFTKESNKGKPFFEKNIYFGKSPFPLWAFILIIVLTSPVWFPVVSSLFGVILGLVFSVFGIILGFFGASIGLIIGGIGLIIGAIATVIGNSVFSGILILGLGLLLIGIGIFLFMFTAQITFIWVPQFIKWIVKSAKTSNKKQSTVTKGEYA